MALHKLICAVDFSPTSDNALRVASQIARDAGAPLVVAHVWRISADAVAFDVPISDDAFERARRKDEAALQAACALARRLGAPDVTSVMLDGVPWDRVVQLAKDDPGVDLIVVGTHGRSGLSRWLLGSVAEQVIRHAPCSILAVRHSSDTRRFRHVLCPIDFSDDSRRAVRQAQDLVAPDGRVTLLHVAEPGFGAGDLPLLEDEQHEIERRAASELARWAEDLQRAAPAEVATELRVGGPAGQILHVLASDPDVDLVVMGSHGRTGIPRVLLGSVAEKVLRHATCPVLVVRDGERGLAASTGATTPSARAGSLERHA